jgi:hypothetical protein
MTTRKQLEETLAAQRARRMNHSTVATHKRGNGWISMLAVTMILILSGAAMFFAVGITTPKASAAITASPSPSVSSSISTASTAPATPVTKQICTHIPNGRLHVRFEAGNGSEVRGYLAEGETVQLALDPDGKTIQGELWLPIAYPIAGWVNARFVCMQEK